MPIKTFKMQVHKFYCHESGRKVAVLCEQETYGFGKQLLVEEAGSDGHHGISTADSGQELPLSEWTEIGVREWLQNFRGKMCPDCAIAFKNGDDVLMDNGVMRHGACYANRKPGKVHHVGGSGIILQGDGKAPDIRTSINSKAV